MNSKKLVLSMAAIMLACSGAAARQTPRTGEAAQQATPADTRSTPAVVAPSPSGQAGARVPDPAASKARQARRPPRRAVEQILTPTPRILGSAVPADAVRGQGMMAGPGPAVSANAGAMSYGPTLETRVPPPSMAPPAGTVGTSPATCAGANCLDSSGQRLGTGIGNAAITPQGRLCTKGLVGVQCF